MVALLSLSILSGVFGVMCLAVGIRGLSEARPVVFNFRWVTWVYIALVVAGIAVSLPDTFRFMPVSSFRVWALWAALVVGILLFVGWLRDGDYVVVGAQRDDFQQALRAALDAQKLSYEETPEGTRLLAPEAVIRVVYFLEHAGSIQVSIRPRRCQPQLDKIAGAMNERFATHPGQPVLLPFRLFTGAGGLGVVLALMLFMGVLIG
jgi:hypothetical protein